MRKRREMAAGVMIATVLAGGAWAGIDAARQVDALYRTVPALRSSRIPAVTPWPPAEVPPVAVAPPAGGIWGREVGRDERAFFEPTLPDEDRVEKPRVRVERLPREELPQYRVPPPPFSDEGEWVQEPAPADDPPSDDPVE